MSPEDYLQLNQLFLPVLELPREQRGPFLAQACVGDAELRRQIERMLSADDEAGHLIDQPVHSAAAELLTDPASGLPGGGRLGHYRLSREIGRGDGRGISGSRRIFLGPAQLGLVRAAAMGSDEVKARQASQAFISAWKDADADLPILLEAKRKLNRLSD
jgi:hypothetical protein